MDNLPQGIRYNLKDYCKNCPCFNIDYSSWTDPKENFTITEITCENKELCQKLIERFKKEARSQILEELNAKN